MTPNTAFCSDNIISNIPGVTSVIEEHLFDHSGQKFIFHCHFHSKTVKYKKIELYSVITIIKFPQN